MKEKIEEAYKGFKEMFEDSPEKHRDREQKIRGLYPAIPCFDMILIGYLILSSWQHPFLNVVLLLT